MGRAFDLAFSTAISHYIICNTYYIIHFTYSTCPACYLRITWLIEYVGYLYQSLICENMFKCKMFFVSILILKFDFNSIWVLSFSSSNKEVSMYYETSWEITFQIHHHVKTLIKERSSSGGRKLPRRNRIRQWRKHWRLKIYVIFKTCC